jgi:PIN domain nuclease of toxin-antitoxin system
MKRYLLDTNILLWWLYDDTNLSKKHREIIINEESEIFVSTATIWEI